VNALIAEQRYDYVFPHFIRHELPAGLRGLLVAALLAAAMSSLDSALSGLASSAYFDLGLTRRDVNEGVLKGPRVLVVAFAIILAVIAVGFGSQPSILWFGLQIMGYTYGGLLGLFAVAFLLGGSIRDAAAPIAAFSSIGVVLIATQWDSGFGFGPVPWPWAVIIGAAWTIVVSVLAGRFFR
jgi:Na+/proline symporter